MFIFVLLCVAFAEKISGWTPESYSSEQGFSLQRFVLTTQDNYKVELWRLNDAMYQYSDGELAERQPVLVVHGFLDCGMFPIYNDRDNSLGYQLFDRGYDVWMLNHRGTTYSKIHETRDTDTKEFWDFSFTEVGRYDLQAAIDYVLSKSNASDTMVVAHSMGTQIVSSLLLKHEEWGFDIGKIRAVALLAPAIYLSHTHTLMVEDLLSQSEESLLKEIRLLFGEKSLMEHYGAIARLPTTCYNHSALCYDFYTWAAGADPEPEAFDEDRLYLYVNFYPAGASVLELSNFTQIAKRDVFMSYDFGADGNIKHYGSADPIVYDVTQFPKSIPLYVVYGGEDAMVDPRDVERLVGDLEQAQLADFRVLYVDSYTHGDFGFALNVPEKYGNELIDFFDEYN